MSDKRVILSLGFGVTLAVLALAGLVLLFAPGIARGLGRASEVAPWALDRRDVPVAAPRRLLEPSGLWVSAAQQRRNQQRWRAMDDAERGQLLDRYARLQQLDPDRRKELVTRYKSLQELSPDRREHLCRHAANLARFEASLGREDRAALDGLSPRDRARLLRELWRASQGLE